mmetsp:Transcript_8508/g.17241  ORF Transcript_8508/g.17241 Transcript_8508/m.17241 type:complete len:230 (-) Transcript_8508:580-1269(-)
MTFDTAVNTAWMEALDMGTGRLYFIKLDNNETSWECPPNFKVRVDLVAEHAKALESLKSGGPSSAGVDDCAFLARIRERFPPPATPPPAGGNGNSAALKAQVEQLQRDKLALQEQVERLKVAAETASAEKATLEQTVEQLTLNAAAVSAGGGAPPSCVGPPSLGSGPKAPSWTRGASVRFANAQLPPPPPDWALQMSKGSSATRVGPLGVATFGHGSHPPLNTRISGAI